MKVRTAHHHTQQRLKQQAERSQQKEITSRNRIDCIDKEVRDFHDGNEFLKIGSRMVRGSIVKRLIPVFEYSKNTIRGKIS